MEENLQPQPAWHKTKAGKIFISILATLFVLGLAFSIFIGYYVFKIKTGGGEELAQQFYQEFSKDPSLSQNAQSGKILYDVDQYVQPTNPVLGNVDAPITIVMFVDFECPSCGKAFPIIKQMIEKYEPVVRVIFKHFPLDVIHANARGAALASVCAHEQNKFWEYHDVLFQNSRLDEDSLFGFAGQLGLDTQKFNTCMTSEKTKAQIDQDQFDGLKLEVQGTPTYFINGIKIEGVIPLENWNELILNQLQK